MRKFYRFAFLFFYHSLLAISLNTTPFGYAMTMDSTSLELLSLSRRIQDLVLLTNHSSFLSPEILGILMQTTDDLRAVADIVRKNPSIVSQIGPHKFTELRALLKEAQSTLNEKVGTLRASIAPINPSQNQAILGEQVKAQNLLTIHITTQLTGIINAMKQVNNAIENRHFSLDPHRTLLDGPEANASWSEKIAKYKKKMDQENENKIANQQHRPSTPESAATTHTEHSRSPSPTNTQILGIGKVKTE